MHLTFLGTGPAIAIPRPGHTDLTCRDARRAGSHSRRLRSSLLVRTGDACLLFDASPDVMEQLEHANVRNPDAIFLTHAHADAMSGVHDLVLSRQEEGGRLPLLCAALPVLARLSRHISAVRARRRQLSDYLTTCILRHGRVCKRGSLRITPFEVRHSMTPGFPTIGFRVNNIFVYASDVASIPTHSLRFIRGIPHLILDASMWFGTQIASHLTVNESIAIARRLKVGHLYLTQISHTYPPHAEAVRAIRAWCRKQKITMPITLAYDGLKISLQ